MIYEKLSEIMWSIIFMDITTLIFSGVVAVTTILYTVLTYCILKQTNRPEISVFLEYRKMSRERDEFYSTYLCVKNTGVGVARHVKFPSAECFSFKPVHSETALNEIDFLVNGIDMMSPGQMISHKVFSLTGPFASILNPDLYKNKHSKVKFDVSYENVRGQSFKNKAVCLDFAKSVDMDSYSFM